MSVKRTKSLGPWFRRAVQIAFLALFVWLFLETRFQEDKVPNRHLQFFFHLDPLILIATFLAAHAVPIAALWALVTLGATVLFGRVFCGWVCPFGTINHFVGWLGALLRGRRAQREEWSPWQRTKYFVLFALVGLALFGVHWIGVFDPFGFFYRSMSTAAYPMAQYATETGANAVYSADPHIGPLHATSVSEPVYDFLKDHVFLTNRQAFLSGGVILFLFAVVVLLNLYKPRFWCRYLCPLGALLGLAAKWPLLLRLTTNRDACNDCGRCTLGCQGACAPGRGGDWIPSECFVCWNCPPKCNFQAVQFKLAPSRAQAPTAPVDLTKRAALTAVAGGAAGMLLFRATPQSQAKAYNPALIRPPGARAEKEFLQRCVQCGLCMKVCPTNGLQPTAWEAGLEGLWTPRLVPKIGYCEYDCNLCSQVCPTEAITPLTIEEKKKTKIGLATFDTTRCLPYAYGRECIVCEEHCPVPDKAIYFELVDVPLRDGKTRVLKQPKVDPDKCIGCGICEKACVFADKAAVRVTSANESRHMENQPILQGFSDWNSDDSFSDTESSEGAPASASDDSAYGDSGGSDDPYGG